MSESPTFSIVTFPKLQEWSATSEVAVALAQKFRDFRLHALKTAPEAFATSYESESQRGLDQTFDRLRSQKATQFVALDAATHPIVCNDKHRLVQARWLGTIVLLGPQDGESGTTISASSDPFARMTAASDEGLQPHEQGSTQAAPVLHYHLNGVFVDPSARRGGLGMALVNIAVRRAEAEANRLDARLLLSIAVDSENLLAKRLYEKAGFKVVGEEMYTQQPRMIKGEAERHERVALQMELSLAATP